jgi:hypothetical protein
MVRRFYPKSVTHQCESNITLDEVGRVVHIHTKMTKELDMSAAHLLHEGQIVNLPNEEKSSYAKF